MWKSIILRYALHMSLTKANLQPWNNVGRFAYNCNTSSNLMSLDTLKVILAALQCSLSKEAKRSAFEHEPHKTIKAISYTWQYKPYSKIE